MKLKKKKRAGKFRGSRTQGYSGKKKKGSGNRGGKGMAGTGKKSGHKLSFVNKYFFPYSGKQGYTSRPTERRINVSMNIGDISKNIDNMLDNNTAKKTSNGYEISLPFHKILGNGDVTEKIIITAFSFSQSAKEKIEKAGGKAISIKKVFKIKVKAKKEEEEVKEEQPVEKKPKKKVTEKK